MTEQDQHRYIKDFNTEICNGKPHLKEHRDFIEQGVWGFGERAFWGFWDVLLATLPNTPRLLEIGVFKGATLSVWRLIREDAQILGITPLSTAGGLPEDDYEARIAELHSHFGQPEPNMLIGESQDMDIVAQAGQYAPYHVVYIDGDHSYEGCISDLVNYAPMVASGGYLVIDDACCDMQMDWGEFQGIKEVTDATLDYMQRHDDEWEFSGNVVHIRIYKRK